MVGIGITQKEHMKYFCMYVVSLSNFNPLFKVFSPLFVTLLTLEPFLTRLVLVLYCVLYLFMQRQVSQRLGSGSCDGEAIKLHPFFKLINWADVLGRKLEPPFKPALVSFSFLIH